MQSCSAQDYGWFTEPDLELLFSALAKLPAPGNVILVGGQALSFWVDYFDIPIPRLSSIYLTQDADFLGSHQDAALLAKELNANIRLATLDDLTPNLAVLSFKGVRGERLMIDFLSVIIGIESGEVRKRAIPMAHGDDVLHVLHPMLCLKSRIENLYQLPGKRNGNGISQAIVSVKVARAYIDLRLKLSRESANGSIPNERGALDAVKQIKDMALSRAARYVFNEYGIDLLEAVNEQKFITDKFRDIQWPKIKQWVSRSRNKN